MLCKMEDVVRKKQPFYELRNEWYMHSIDDFVVCLGDFNGCLGGHIDGGIV